MKTILQCEQIDTLFKHQCVYTNVLIDQFACGHDKTLFNKENGCEGVFTCDKDPR